MPSSGFDPNDPTDEFVALMTERSFPGGTDVLPYTGSTQIDLGVIKVAWALQVVRDELASLDQNDPGVQAASLAANVLNEKLAELNSVIASKLA